MMAHSLQSLEAVRLLSVLVAISRVSGNDWGRQVGCSRRELLDCLQWLHELHAWINRDA